MIAVWEFWPWGFALAMLCVVLFLMVVRACPGLLKVLVKS